MSDHATAVDRFAFAMEVERVDGLLRLRPTPAPTPPTATFA